MLVLWKISMGETQKNIKLSNKMYHVIKVKLKINSFYEKKKKSLFNIEVKMD